MSDKGNDFGICECGDPSCTCKKGECDCVQPSEKFLPKEDKKPLKDHTINLPVDPAVYLNTYDGESLYNGKPPKGTYQAAKLMEIPQDNTFFKDKQAAIETGGNEAFPFWNAAISRLKAQLGENIERMACDTNIKFYSKPCSWRIGNDGMREVAFNYIEEVKTPIGVSGSMASSAKQMVPSATWDRKLVLSKHMDDKSAMLACQAYNEFLSLKK